MDLSYLRELSTISGLSPNNIQIIQTAAQRALAAISLRSSIQEPASEEHASKEPASKEIDDDDDSNPKMTKWLDHAEIETDPIQEEQADLHRALVQSKGDAPCLVGDNLVVLRLNSKHSHAIPVALDL